MRTDDVRFEAFDWDAWNIDHITRHRVEPYEVEAACRSTHALVLRGREGCYLVYSRTGSGRYLFIVLRRLSGQAARIITARDMTPRERRFYQGRH